MTIPFAGTISVDSVSFTGPSGKNFIISTAHPNNAAIRDKIKSISTALAAGALKKVASIHAELEILADVPMFIERESSGRVVVKNNTLIFDGELIHNSLSRRILWGLSEGFDMGSYIMFLENLMENPSKQSIDELFDFLEACNMGITDDGHFLAYKRVRPNLTDIRTGTFDNSPGCKPTMPRNKVDDRRTNECSSGLHFCSFTYLPNFASAEGNRVVILKINPKDVVSIPQDYAHAKGRCSTYEVVGEYTGADLHDILSTNPVWKQQPVRDKFGLDGAYEYTASAAQPRHSEIVPSTLHESDTHYHLAFVHKGASFSVIETEDSLRVTANDNDIKFDGTFEIDVAFSYNDVKYAVTFDDGMGQAEVVATEPLDTVYPEKNPDGSINGWVGNSWVPVIDAHGHSVVADVIQPKEKSSFITALGYDTGTLTLRVEVRGDIVYEYVNVPLAEYTAFAAAESLGTYFNAHVKGFYHQTSP